MLSIKQLHPDDRRSREILRCYLEDVASSYHGRPLSEAAVEAAVAEFPNDDLAAPHGALLVALLSGAAVGCVGLRILANRIGEVTRLYVARPHRRQGVGARLMAELEELARHHQLATLRLDTRHDLIEARALYARLGFREVAPFNSGRYAEHWFEKMLV